MNIHPLVVHFAIGLLSVYSVAEFIRFRKVIQNQHWFYIKLFLVTIGSLGLYAALFSGDMAEHFIQNRELRNVIEAHYNAAVIASVIYSCLALVYIIRWVNKDFSTASFRIRIITTSVLSNIWNMLSVAAAIMSKPSVSIVVALLGIVSLTITGALGAAIVYGPDFDPFVSLAYKLFVQ